MDLSIHIIIHYFVAKFEFRFRFRFGFGPKMKCHFRPVFVFGRKRKIRFRSVFSSIVFNLDGMTVASSRIETKGGAPIVHWHGGLRRSLLVRPAV